MSDALFWRLTLTEIEALVDRYIDQERQRTLRATYIAATILNVHREKGTRLIQAWDLIREPRTDEDYMTVEESRSLLNRWAKTINADYEQGLIAAERIRDE